MNFVQSSGAPKCQMSVHYSQPSINHYTMSLGASGERNIANGDHLQEHSEETSEESTHARDSLGTRVGLKRASGLGWGRWLVSG
jgi:hypothetical protein